jgi:glyceraldehyde 3-phosphate dehydrogenase
LVLFRNHLVDITTSEIINLHNYAEKVVGKQIHISATSELAEEIFNLNLAAAKIDIGKLAYEWSQEENNFSSKADFLKSKLGAMMNGADQNIEPRDVVLYGFGRIGRLAARELIKQAGKGQQLRLRAIVTRNASADQITKRAALLRNDSVHNDFKGTVTADIDNKAIIINGQIVKMIEASNPEDIDYTAYDINNALIIDNTGVFSFIYSFSLHLKAKGAEKVLLTAPGKEIPNIVYGINHFDLDIDGQNIFSAASCTTNAITPVLNVIND